MRLRALLARSRFWGVCTAADGTVGVWHSTVDRSVGGYCVSSWRMRTRSWLVVNSARPVSSRSDA
jgi:hypothetical protein